MNELIIVEQLPIIKEQIKQASELVSIKVENALSLVCNEETVKEIKNIRAELNKELKAFEETKKEVEKEVLAPWNDFKARYKESITDKYKLADSTLGARIAEVETALKDEKSDKIKAYFDEYLQSKNIDFITYGQAGINVTLSASEKSLKEQAKTFIDKVADDLSLIETQEHKAEILVEYKQDLNVSQAITTVSARHKAIEEEKARLEPKVDEVKEKIEPRQIETPKPVEKENVQSMSFLVNRTPFELDRLRKFLNEYEYDWEVEL